MSIIYQIYTLPITASHDSADGHLLNALAKPVADMIFASEDHAKSIAAQMRDIEPSAHFFVRAVDIIFPKSTEPTPREPTASIDITVSKDGNLQYTTTCWGEQGADHFNTNAYETLEEAIVAAIKHDCPNDNDFYFRCSIKSENYTLF